MMMMITAIEREVEDITAVGWATQVNRYCTKGNGNDKGRY